MSELLSNTRVGSSTTAHKVPSQNLFSTEKHSQQANQHQLQVQRIQDRKRLQKRWEKEEFRTLLCFVVRFTIDNPYLDIEDILLNRCTQHHQVLEMISKTIGSRTLKQCQRFTQTIIKEVHRRTSQHLVPWAVQNLKRKQEIPQVDKILSEYAEFTNTKSRYMAAIEQLDEALRNQEIF